MRSQNGDFPASKQKKKRRIKDTRKHKDVSSFRNGKVLINDPHIFTFFYFFIFYSYKFSLYFHNNLKNY